MMVRAACELRTVIEETAKNIMTELAAVLGIHYPLQLRINHEVIHAVCLLREN